MSQAEQVSRMDAARRQLDQAIQLFFRRGDAISIHTLAAAALQILRDVAKRKNIPNAMLESMQLIVRSEYQKMFWNKLREAEGFFKHADQGPIDHSISFYPKATPFFIIEAVALYQKLEGRTFPSAEVFWAWFALKHPDVLKASYKYEVREKSVGIDPDDYDQFLEVILSPQMTGKGNSSL